MLAADEVAGHLACGASRAPWPLTRPALAAEAIVILNEVTMVRTVCWYGIAFMAVLLIGCSDDTADPQPQGGSFDVVVVANIDSFSIGNIVTLTVTATNRTNEIIDFGEGSSNCWLWAKIDGEGISQRVPWWRACYADYAVRILEPGEEHTETLTWNGSIWNGEELVPAPVGTYEIFGLASGAVGSPVTVELLE